MSDALSEPFSEQAEREAIAWQARLSSDLLADEQRLAFDAWLTANPEHRAAWRAINDFWSGLDLVDPADLGISARQAAPAAPSTAPSAIPLPRRLGFRSRSADLALAASVLLAFGLVFGNFADYLADYRSAVGSQREIALEDGSSLVLNTDSAASVDYSTQRRLVTLHRGEAFFRVAADPARPFVVETGAGRVRALGTAFDVKYLAGAASVTVYEHAVAVETVGGAVLDKLGEAEQLAFDRDRIGPVQPVNPQRAGAWHQQRIVFQDQALAKVVEELERYRPGKIVILDAAIENLPITGVFGIADTDLALQAIAQSLPVRVRLFGDHLVVLSAR